MRMVSDKNCAGQRLCQTELASIKMMGDIGVVAHGNYQVEMCKARVASGVNGWFRAGMV